MLAMAAEELGRDTLFWDDDQSWSFPLLIPEENGENISMGMGESEGQKTKEVEAPPPPAREKKRRAAEKSGAGGDKVNEKKGGCGDQSIDHELHIWTERERRKKMRDMFANLHALIPHLPQRADKSTIVDEAILYIKKLQLTVENLEKLKDESLKGKTAISTVCDQSMLTQNTLAAIQSREAFLAQQGSTSTQAVTLANPNPPSFLGPEIPAAFKTWTSPNVILNVCGKDAHISVCCPKKAGQMTAIFFVMEKYNLEVVSAQVSSCDRCRRMYTIHARANGVSQQFPEAVFLVEELYKQAAVEIIAWIKSF